MSESDPNPLPSENFVTPTTIKFTSLILMYLPIGSSPTLNNLSWVPSPITATFLSYFMSSSLIYLPPSKILITEIFAYTGKFPKTLKLSDFKPLTTNGGDPVKAPAWSPGAMYWISGTLLFK